MIAGGVLMVAEVVRPWNVAKSHDFGYGRSNADDRRGAALMVAEVVRPWNVAAKV